MAKNSLEINNLLTSFSPTHYANSMTAPSSGVRSTLFARRIRQTPIHFKALLTADGFNLQNIVRLFHRYAQTLHFGKQKSSIQAWYALIEAYNTLKKTHQYARPLLMPYYNEQTFLFLENVFAIAKSDLLVLDGYAFDVNELVENAKHNPEQLYRNPHITSTEENTAFSPAARRLIREHKMTRAYARALDDRLGSQAFGITTDTVNAVETLVKALDEGGAIESDKALAEFVAYFQTLNSDDQQLLNDYIIQIPSTHGGVQALRFEAALHGGNRFDRCIITARMYLWQFVVQFKPGAMLEIPPQLLRNAEQEHGLKIQPLDSTYTIIPENNGLPNDSSFQADERSAIPDEDENENIHQIMNDVAFIRNLRPTTIVFVAFINLLLNSENEEPRNANAPRNPRR